MGKPDTVLQKVCCVFPLSIAYAFVLGATRTFRREREDEEWAPPHTLSSWIIGASSASCVPLLSFCPQFLSELLYQLVALLPQPQVLVKFSEEEKDREGEKKKRKISVGSVGA